MTPRGQLRQRMAVGTAPPPAPAVAPDRASGSSPVGPEAIPNPGSEPEPRIPAYMGIFMVAILTFIYLFWTALKESRFTPDTIWYAHDLALCNGTDENLPILLSITGSVFDVSKGAKHYGKGNAYNHFCGRDATRAFVSGNFSGEGLTDNVAGLTLEQLHGLEQWRGFYFKTYRHVGKLVGRFYDVDGKPTKVLQNLLRRFQRAQLEMAKGKVEEDRYPHCSSKWTPESGGEVWCESGYPRKFFKAGGSPEANHGTQTRCACVQDEDLGQPNQQEYPNCPSEAKHCLTVPPENVE